MLQPRGARLPAKPTGNRSRPERGVRTITGAHYLTRNDAILESSVMQQVWSEAKQAHVFFYKYSISTNDNLQTLGRSQANHIVQIRVRPASILD